jgi:sphingosine kinase
MHAYDIVKDELQVGEYDGIITISGDGLIHEVVNGAMSRPDFE